MADFTHFDERGNAIMVDIGSKPETSRFAAARGEITMSAETLKMIREGRAHKGDVLGVARLAGIMAAKKTAGLIPLCHPIAFNQCAIAFFLNGEDADREQPQVSRLYARDSGSQTGIHQRQGADSPVFAGSAPAKMRPYDADGAADNPQNTIVAECTVSLSGKTGAEMEALTGVSVALLTIYDMCKAVERGMVIGSIRLIEKSGGKSGHYRAS
ncbi:MAG: cyclic pyranopterin monophosphate synthase MoaC [Spirochaetaceae bacterium]|jgi:cyclic pyranopterin phosphate synthase|nr:cyclic pyranopterin monophosphate synthase MoaC [Spirochaetaceae bacterium]